MNKYVRALFNFRMLIVLLMGFSSGLPLLLLGSTLKAWMIRSDVSLGTMGLFALVGLPYTLKFVWAPLLDRYTIGILGRRRGWLILSQIGLAASLFTLSRLNPSSQLSLIAQVSLFIAFFSATQDIAIDAYRREILSTSELALGTSLSVFGYRLGMMVAGGVALFIAADYSYPTMYMVMAAIAGSAIFVSLVAKEPVLEFAPPRTLREAVVDPIKEFLMRPGALWIVVFILLFKVGDTFASEQTMALYMRGIHFDEKEVASVVKIFGIWAVIAGGIIGGLVIVRLGIMKSLWIFGILQAVSTLGFAWLYHQGPQVWALATAVTFENVTGGMGSTAFVAFMASITNKRYTATQYAVLSSLMGVPRVILASGSGYVLEALGYSNFFIFCAIMAIPGLFLILKVQKYGQALEDHPTSPPATLIAEAPSAKA